MTYALIAWRFLRGLPWWAYAILAAIAIVWLAYRAGYNARDERADREMAEMLASVAEGQETARANQQAAMDREQARYDELAERIDRDDPPTRIAVADATDRYRRDNRMCPNAGSAASATDSAPVSDDTGSVEAVPASGFVAVSDLDVQRCADANRYAITAHNFLMGLSAD